MSVWDANKRPWWQDNLGAIVKAVSLLVVLVGVIWGGGAWMASMDTSNKAMASTLEKIDKRVDVVKERLTANESKIETVVRDGERLYKVSKRLQKAVVELKVITAELKAISKSR